MTLNTLDILKDLMGIGEAVSFREFVSGEDYCNNPDMYEYWYQKYDETGININELILDGSLGGGKSWMAAFYLAYRVYLLFFNGSPQAQLKVAEGSDIFVLYFSTSMTQAKRSGFQYIYNIFATCKWFEDNAPINHNLKSSVEFVDKHFCITYASDFGHQIGLNVWGFILDEANFKGVGVGLGTEEQYEAVTELYEQLLDRQLSRYARPDGSVEALAILISSASYQSSFVEKRKALVKGDKYAKVITSCSYETKPHLFSKETFDVFIGCGAVEPCIITSEEQKLKLLQSAGVLGTGEEETFIKHVPINLRKSFETNVVLALQNHCGVPTNMSSSFMSNMKYLYDSYVGEDVIKPILQSFYLEASTADDTELIEYLLPNNIEYNYRPHSLFLDLSVQNDTAALVCVRYDGKDERDQDIHTRVFSLKIVPPKFPDRTKISKVQRFVIDLAKYINIVAFGSDQYQSTELRQEVNAELGIDDIRISIDSSDIPHIHWMRGLTEGRLKQTRDELLEKEVKEAVHDWKKHRVLKATKSSDDCLQANVGAFYLSDTVGKNVGTVEGLYKSKGPINILGSSAFKRFMKESGYKTNTF